MKAQAQVWVYGEGGEQLAVLNGPVAEASFGIVDFFKTVATWVADFWSGKWVQLATDVGMWLQTLGGDVHGQGVENESFAQGGTLYNGDPRLASYALVFFHAWTGDDIKPSHAGVEPATPPGIIDLGEVRYTRGDFQYEYRYLIQFSLLAPGKYSFAFATGDSGTVQDATIAYTVGLQIDPPKIELLSIQQKHDTMVAHGWFDFGQATTDELAAPDGIGRYRHYQNGSLYWSPGRGAHLVLGAIRGKWAETGWERGLGYPLTAELPTADGVGRFNNFQSASIFWSPTTGAREVHGAIRERWASLGWERSYLGYPITDEVRVGDAADTRYSNFQGGSIRWTARTGAMDYRQQMTAGQEG